MTRRQWLASSIALAVPALSAGSEVPPSFPFGFSLYGMKTLSLEDAIAACAKIGYDGVELACMPGYHAEPKLLDAGNRKEIRKRLFDSGLGLLGLMENLAEPAKEDAALKNLDRLKAAAELGHALSPDAVPPIETILGGKTADWEANRNRIVERLGAWAVVCKDAKTIIAVKPHISNSLRTPEAALWLIQQVNSPWIRLAYDYSHFQLQGLAMAKTVQDLAKHCVFAHIKDAKGTPEKVEFLLPGDGGTDYPALLLVMKADGYMGLIVVEVSGMVSNKKDYDPVAAAKKCYESLAKAFEGYRPKRK